MPKRPSESVEIVYVINALDRGGAELHLASVCPALLVKGWHPTIFCLSHKGELADTLSAAGVTIVAPISSRSASKLLRLLNSFLAAAALWRYLRRQQPRFVHFYLPLSYCLGAPTALLAGMRQLVMSRRSRNHYLDRRPLIRWWEGRLHRRMTLVLGNSKRVVADLLAEGAHPDRVRLIYNGVAIESFYQAQSRRSATRAALGVNQDFLMICVANLIAYKGHADLIAALIQYNASLPSNWRLLLIGRDEGIGAALKAGSAHHAIAGRILFLGSRADVPDLLSAADLFILPSHEEGFSNAVLEAMAAGLPVIATDVGGNAEAVIEGKTGLLVPAKAPERLGAAIAALANATTQSRAFGSAGAERVKQLFSLEVCVEKYDQLYRSLVDTKLD